MKGSLTLIDRLFVGTLLVIFGGIVLHAPLSVGFSTLWPSAEYVIQSWKEILMGFALLLGVVILTTQGKWGILRSKLIYLLAAYAGLHLLMIPIFYTGFEQTVAGLFIDLRHILFFGLIFIAMKLYPQLYGVFMKAFVAGAVLVVGFATLQATVLPNDVLKHIGYGDATIQPYLTVDENDDYVRINSTLRGPNPLGAYAAIVLAMALAFMVRPSRRPTRNEQIVLWVLAIGSVIALWASYSRSAALAAAIALGIVLMVVYGKQVTKVIWLALAVGAIALAGSLFVFRETTFVSQVILHEDPNEGNDVNSNDGHVDSLVDGTDRMLRQPLGGGIGSTGSASLLGDDGLIIENEYLYVAHEVGWIGLGFFLVIYADILVQLWRKRTWWLALATFASGVGLAVGALFLPVWADDTVAIIWWGLAAIAVALPLDKARQAHRAMKGDPS